MASLGSSLGEISPEPFIEVEISLELDERGWGGAESANISSSSSEHSRSRWSSTGALEGGCEGASSVGEWGVCMV